MEHDQGTRGWRWLLSTTCTVANAGPSSFQTPGQWTLVRALDLCIETFTQSWRSLHFFSRGSRAPANKGETEQSQAVGSRLEEGDLISKMWQRGLSCRQRREMGLRCWAESNNQVVSGDTSKAEKVPGLVITKGPWA